MVEYVSAAQMRAGGATVVMNYSSHIHDALTLEELIAAFRDAATLEGVCRHRCNALDDGRQVFLFGDREGKLKSADTAAQVLNFPITGWDDMSYEVEIALFPGLSINERRASLHAMAALYLARGLALLDAEDEPAATGLTQIERYCLDARRQGRSNLDIAEALDRSVHAVTVHFQRAARKLHD